MALSKITNKKQLASKTALGAAGVKIEEFNKLIEEIEATYSPSSPSSNIINVAAGGSIADAYTEAKALNPTKNNPVDIILAPGTYTENIVLDTSYINIRGDQPRTVLREYSNPGINSTFVAGTKPAGETKSYGYITGLSTSTPSVYTGETLTIGTESWTGTNTYTGEPFTFDTNYSEDSTGSRDMYVHLRDVVNTQNTQGLQLEYHFGTVRNEPTYFAFTRRFVIQSIGPDHASKNGISFSWSAGISYTDDQSTLAGGVDGTDYIGGAVTPDRQRSVIIDGDILVRGAIGNIASIDCNNFYSRGYNKGSRYTNLLIYGEAYTYEDYSIWEDCHAPSFLADSNILGYFYQCSGGDYSFGGKAQVGSNYSGVYEGVPFGYIYDCETNDYGFGQSLKRTLLKNCIGRDYCFGHNREANFSSFELPFVVPASASNNATFIECSGRDYCFNNITSSDIINISTGSTYPQGICYNCTGNNYCFNAYDWATLETTFGVGTAEQPQVVGGIFIQCTAVGKAFCHYDTTGSTNPIVIGTSNNGGSMYDCNAGSGSFFFFKGSNLDIDTFGGSDAGYYSVINCSEGFERTIDLSYDGPATQGGFYAYYDGASGQGGGIYFYNCYSDCEKCFGVAHSDSATGKTVEFYTLTFDNCTQQTAHVFGYSATSSVGVLKNYTVTFYGQIAYKNINSNRRIFTVDTGTALTVDGVGILEIKNCITNNILNTVGTATITNGNRIVIDTIIPTSDDNYVEPTENTTGAVVPFVGKIYNSRLRGGASPALTIGAGAVVGNCIITTTSGSSIGGGTVTASIYKTATNNGIAGTITNDVTTNGNINDTNIQ